MLGYSDLLRRPSIEMNLGTINQKGLTKILKNAIWVWGKIEHDSRKKGWWRHWVYKSQEFTLNGLTMTHGTVDKALGYKVLLSGIIWRLQVQSEKNNKEHLLQLNTCAWSRLTELEQSTLED